MADSKPPVFGTVAVLSPVIGVALIWGVLGSASSGRGYGLQMVIPVFGVPSTALGVISAVAAILRKERWRWLAWGALALNLSPLGWLLTEI
jgi:hypothetical protein